MLHLARFFTCSRDFLDLLKWVCDQVGMKYNDKFNPRQPPFMISFFPLLCFLGVCVCVGGGGGGGRGRGTCCIISTAMLICIDSRNAPVILHISGYPLIGMSYIKNTILISQRTCIHVITIQDTKWYLRSSLQHEHIFIFTFSLSLHRMSANHILIFRCNFVLISVKSSFSLSTLHAVPSSQPDLLALYCRILYPYVTLFSAHLTLGQLRD